MILSAGRTPISSYGETIFLRSQLEQDTYMYVYKKKQINPLVFYTYEIVSRARFSYGKRESGQSGFHDAQSPVGWIMKWLLTMIIYCF